MDNEMGKLEWIYKGTNSLVNREDYLLGRKVDKTLEQLNEEEQKKKFNLPIPKNHVEHECIPPSIRDFNKIVHAEQVDMSTKLQEDPLIAIKRREEEARRQFLQNPVQLKKLQNALKLQKNKKKKKKKSKLDDKMFKKLKLVNPNGTFNELSKNERKNHDILDTILMHKYNTLKDKLTKDDFNDIINGKFTSDSSSEEEHYYKKKNHKESQIKEKNRIISSKEQKSRKKFKKYWSDDKSDTKTQSNINYHSERKQIKTIKCKTKSLPESTINKDDEREIQKKDKFNNLNNEKNKNKLKLRQDSDVELDKLILKNLKSLRENSNVTNKYQGPVHFKILDIDPCELDNTQKYVKDKTFGLVSFQGKQIALKHNISKTEQPKCSKIQNIIKPEIITKYAKKMSESEKEKLRTEMIMNAAIRDKEREFNVKKYKKEDLEEEETIKTKYDKDLVHSKLVKSTVVSSVEERIKSNINNIQRSSRQMNSHFSRR